MGGVAQAVLEFDEEVQVPWRPRLVSVPEPTGTALPARPRPTRGRPSRVGVCRPSAPARQRPPGVSSSPGRARTPGRRAAVRFTRRAHRLAVALALCGGVVAGSWLGQLFQDGGAHGLRLAGVSSVVVVPGDTLWSIARSVAEGDDVRIVVDRIQELNGLDDAELVPGQVLLLP